MIIQEEASNESDKERLVTQSEDADIPSLDPISCSEKELQGDSNISEIRLRNDPNNPERGFIDKRSFWSASVKYVDITSGSEFEMDTHHSKVEQDDNQRVNFYEVDQLSEESLKELEIEESHGSLKEEYLEEIIEEKSYYSSKEHTSFKDADIGSKESSKQKYSRSGESRGRYAKPIQEESEEEDSSIISKKESLGSQCDQLSSSEQESTPKNRQPFLDENYRQKVLKINTILKKTPSSMALIAKNYLKNQTSNPLRHSQPNPVPEPPPRDRQNLYDYGTSNQRYGLPSQNSMRPVVNKSLENLPRKKDEYSDYGAPQDKWNQQPFSDPNKQGLLLSEHPFNHPKSRTELSNNSKDTFKRSFGARDSVNVDWATTPIYFEYMDDGFTKYNFKGHQAFFDEQEVSDIFKLLKTRYANTTEHKKVEPMFHKAMDTLGELLGSFSLVNVFRAIQKMYTKADAQNTMKLVLRVNSLIKVRQILFQIFGDIVEFKVRI